MTATYETGFLMKQSGRNAEDYMIVEAKGGAYVRPVYGFEKAWEVLKEMNDGKPSSKKVQDQPGNLMVVRSVTSRPTPDEVLKIHWHQLEQNEDMMPDETWVAAVDGWPVSGQIVRERDEGIDQIYVIDHSHSTPIIVKRCYVHNGHLEYLIDQLQLICRNLICIYCENISELNIE